MHLLLSLSRIVKRHQSPPSTWASLVLCLSVFLAAFPIVCLFVCLFVCFCLSFLFSCLSRFFLFQCVFSFPFVLPFVHLVPPSIFRLASLFVCRFEHWFLPCDWTFWPRWILPMILCVRSTSRSPEQSTKHRSIIVKVFFILQPK